MWNWTNIEQDGSRKITNQCWWKNNGDVYDEDVGDVEGVGGGVDVMGMVKYISDLWIWFLMDRKTDRWLDIDGSIVVFKS